MACANEFVSVEFSLPLNADSLDTVFIELFDDRPLTRDNFLQYVDGGHYDDTFMHRLAKGFVLQGGGFYEELQLEPSLLNASLNPEARVDLDGDPETSNPTVDNEFENSPMRSNQTGTLAMAKVGGDPDSATNQFFFNLGNNTSLDTQNGGFTVFAEVRGNGMTLLNAYNTGLMIRDLNPDDNDDGVRDPGPFGSTSTDGVPTLGGSQLLKMKKASRVQYYGEGDTIEVPSDTHFFFQGIESFLDEDVAFSGSTERRLVIGRASVLGIAPGATIENPLSNFGTFTPGLQLGAVNLPSFRQATGAILEMQLRGETAGDHHDQLIATGNADLDGVLEVSTIAGFEPQLGDSFVLIDAGSINGDFATLVAPELGTNLSWHVETTSTQVVLSVVQSGDFNGDGAVDGGDYALWQNHYGTTGHINTDGNCDGHVDMADYTFWRDALHAASAAAPPATAAPEPAAGALFAALIVTGGRAREKKAGLE